MGVPTVPGSRFGMLVAVEKTAKRKGRGSVWRFKCDCGNEVERAIGPLYHKGTNHNCGCYRPQHAAGERHGRHKHGASETKLYSVWIAMKQRCETASNKSFPNYGGRGIRVCDAWREFAAFQAWAISAGYAEGLAIDRIDNDGPYAPENCRWVSQAENNRNTRLSIRHGYWGEELALYEAARKFKMDPNTIKRRIARGMTPEEAVAMKGRLSPSDHWAWH